MTDPKIAAVQGALAAFADRDIDRMFTFLTEDVSWQTPGRSPIAGDFRGTEQVRGYLELAIRLTADSIRVAPVDILVGREHVAIVVDVTGERAGRVLADRAIQIFLFRGDRIAARRIYPADQAAWDSFWSG